MSVDAPRLLVQLAEPDLVNLVRAAVRAEMDAIGAVAGNQKPHRAHLTPKEAAIELGCSERHVRTLVQQGRLKAAKLVPGAGSSRVRVTRASVERLLTESTR